MNSVHVSYCNSCSYDYNEVPSNEARPYGIVYCYEILEPSVLLSKVSFPVCRTVALHQGINYKRGLMSKAE